MEIEFDPKKAKSNLRKHSVSFEEAHSVLFDEHAIWIEDPDAIDECRWIIWGIGKKNRLLAVVITTRDDRIRVISARKATRKESRNYAKRI